MWYIIGFFIIAIIMYLIAEKTIYVLCFLAIIALIVFLYKVYKNSNYGRKQVVLRNKRIIENAYKLQEKLNSLNIYPTHIVEYKYSKLYFDENNRKLYLNLLYEDVIVDFDDIIDYEIISDSVSNLKYTLKTSLTGQFDSKDYVKSLSVRIHINSIDKPYINILCLGNGSKHSADGMTVYEATEFANNIIGALDYVKNNKVKKKPIINLIPELETEFVPKESNNIVRNFFEDDKNKKRLKKIFIILGIFLVVVFLSFIYLNLNNESNNIKNISGTKNYKTNLSLEEAISSKDYGSLAYNLLNNELTDNNYIDLIQSNDKKVYEIFYKVKEKNIDYYYDNFKNYTDEFIEYILKESSFENVSNYKYSFDKFIINDNLEAYKLLVSNKRFTKSLLDYFDGNINISDDKLDNYKRYQEISKKYDYMLANINAGHCDKVYTTYYTNNDVMMAFTKCANNTDIFSEKISESIYGTNINIIDFESFIKNGGNVNYFKENVNLGFALTNMSYDNKRDKEVMNLISENNYDFNLANANGLTIVDYIVNNVTKYDYCNSKDEFEKNQCSNGHKWYNYVYKKGGRCRITCSNLDKLNW